MLAGCVGGQQQQKYKLGEEVRPGGRTGRKRLVKNSLFDKIFLFSCVKVHAAVR